MEYDNEYLKKQLSLQGIAADEEDLSYVQRVLSIIRQGEEHLEKFPDLENQKIILTMDMEELKND